MRERGVGARRGLAEEWEWPRRVEQLDLFPRPRNTVLGLLGVSIAEVDCWRARGWISFDVRDVAQLDESRICEIAFVRSVARSGLRDDEVAALLGKLPRPLAYAPERMAYSFKYGWVQAPLRPSMAERDRFVKEQLPGWIDEKVLLGDLEALERLRGQAIVAVAQVRAAREPRSNH